MVTSGLKDETLDNDHLAMAGLRRPASSDYWHCLMQAALKTPLGRSKGIAHPTLAFTVSSTYLLDQPVRKAGSKPAATSQPEAAVKSPAASEAGPQQPAARPPTPGEQLVLKNVPLDEAFEKNMVKDERGIFTWSTSRSET